MPRPRAPWSSSGCPETVTRPGSPGSRVTSATSSRATLVPGSTPLRLTATPTASTRAATSCITPLATSTPATATSSPASPRTSQAGTLRPSCSCTWGMRRGRGVVTSQSPHIEAICSRIPGPRSASLIGARISMTAAVPRCGTPRSSAYLHGGSSRSSHTVLGHRTAPGRPGTPLPRRRCARVSSRQATSIARLPAGACGSIQRSTSTPARVSCANRTCRSSRTTW